VPSSPDRPTPSSRESVLLRGASAAQATLYVEPPAPAPGPRISPELLTRALRPAPAAPVAPVTPPAGAPARPDAGPDAGPLPERRTTIRRAADMPVAGSPLRLGDVYAEELARLRGRAHEEGYAAGFAEGTAAAGVVVARAEQEAQARLAEVQARWERRTASAAAALGDAVRRLEEATLPVAEEVRDTVLTAVVTLVEDVLGRELALAVSPGLDALRRALTLCPEDAPTVVRLHPDDLAEVPAGALAGLPAAVTVVGDARVERAGALAEAGARRIDAQIGPALERVQAVLAL
jgi:flagellar assembly protein FliH